MSNFKNKVRTITASYSEDYRYRGKVFASCTDSQLELFMANGIGDPGRGFRVELNRKNTINKPRGKGWLRVFEGGHRSPGVYVVSTHFCRSDFKDFFGIDRRAKVHGWIRFMLKRPKRNRN